MAQKKYRIKLSEEERRELKAVVASKVAVSKRHRAQILLCADENHVEGGMKDRDIARAVGVLVSPLFDRDAGIDFHYNDGHTAVLHAWENLPKNRLYVL